MDLTKLASKLYPRWWRERYGEEFAALLEDARPGIGGTVDIAKGAFAMQFSTFSVSQTIMAGAVLGVALGYSASLFLHPQFTSSAMISVIPGRRLANGELRRKDQRHDAGCLEPWETLDGGTNLKPLPRREDQNAG